jgi:ADP-heptose:LPS heptosyltransferase
MVTLARAFSRLRVAPRLAAKLLRHGVPRHLVLFGSVSLGDDVLCTAIFRELARRGARRLWMMSRHPGLFAGNPDVDRVAPIDDYHARLLQRLGTRVTQPYYFTDSADRRRHVPPPRPVIAQMCHLAGITGEVSLRPWLHLTPNERARGRLAERQIVMHSSGRSAGFAMANKEWYPEGFQAVADALTARFRVVQLGSPLDPPLQGALDLRGKTTLRESAAIIAAARAVVCQVGLLMHLARAVDTRAVVIFGGVEDPAITGYTANENLTTAVDCATCWMPNDCPHDRKCMDAITPAQVLSAVVRTDARFGEPLPVESFTLPA